MLQYLRDRRLRSVMENQGRVAGLSLQVILKYHGSARSDTKPQNHKATKVKT